MGRKKQVITGIDIGTSWIRVLIGEYEFSTENINIIGYSEKNSEGVVKGEITDLIKVSAILGHAVQEAEQMSNTAIDQEHLYVAVTGGHITSTDGAGTILIDSENKIITQQHISDVLKSTRNQIPPHECIILDTIDGNFILDDTYHVDYPVGQTASKLEAKTHIIYANKNRVESYLNIVKDLGFETCTPVFSGTASALSVLTTDDFDHGTLVINIGSGTTEYVIFENFTATASFAIPVGLNHVINDLYLGLEIDFPYAKDLLNTNIVKEQKEQGFTTIEKKGTLKTRQLPIQTIEKIIDLRLKEIFEIIYEKLQISGHINSLTNGVVLCGGGSLIPTSHELARNVFDMPVRNGISYNVSGPDSILNSTGYLTSVGLLKYGAHEIQTLGKHGSKSIVRNIDHKLWSFWKRIWRVMINEK